MKQNRTFRIFIGLAIAALVAIVFFNLSESHHRVMASGLGFSQTQQRDDDLRRFAGCWTSGNYSLYIPKSGDRGKIRHGDLGGKEDPQMIIIEGIEEDTMTGKWMSDIEFKSSKDSKGQKRRGTFMLTRNGDQLNGTAHESDESEVEGFRGIDWAWNWTLRTDDEMCKQ